ncbi:kinase-like protein [Coprinopsis marcescibilis]|uniref:Kinase-like protein n=1 Tax=Coprinopsis marcescibilis TaxID=230819 RepID=A0A5C3L281_COPMA|nr:kinase-like protein [Coprinopsis marcescibilis]
MAQITAQFAPIPGYGLIVDTLCNILQLCNNVGQNKYAAAQLAERCHLFVNSLKDTEQRRADSSAMLLTNEKSQQNGDSEGHRNSISAAKVAVRRQLEAIETRMNRWAKLGKIKSFIDQDEIAREIMECHNGISDCINKFQLESQFEILEWQSEFAANSERDHKKLLENMAELKRTQEATLDVARDSNELLRSLMDMMQKAMSQNKQTAEKIQQGLSVNLYQLQQQCGELLPDLNLSSGEVKRISEFPVAGTTTMDIYEGLYLGKEKVSMKAIRAMKADDKSLQRFKREGEIWAKVWQKDRGQYIVPFYGFCQPNGPFPYMISPWQDNGNALAYVKANDRDVNYPDFLTRIATGVSLLHTFNPPIVHGDIKSVNILINEEGNPRLSDFGLSQIINDVAGTPFTQSSIVAESFRYFAPEVCQGTGKMSTMSDIYALGMTFLEILTHQQPYGKVKHHTEAILKAARGIKPARPTEERVRERGLDDNLWNTICESWSLEPQDRPTIQKFIDVLKTVPKH